MDDQSKQMMAIINRALSGFPASQSGTSDEVIDAYVLALSPIPSEYLALAVTNLLQGKVESYGSAFAPTPVQIAKEARRVWHYAIDQEQRIEKQRQQFEALPQSFEKGELEHRKEFVDAKLNSMDLGKDMRGKPVVSSGGDKAAERDEAGKWLDQRKGAKLEMPEVSNELREKMGENRE